MQIAGKGNVMNETGDTPDGFDDFFDGYVECALWSSIGTYNGEDVNLDNSDFELAGETLVKLRIGALAWFIANKNALGMFMLEQEVDDSQCGHFHWLSENGHGSGWFDFTGPWADYLDEIDTTSEVNLYIGDDGKIYL